MSLGSSGNATIRRPRSVGLQQRRSQMVDLLHDIDLFADRRSNSNNNDGDSGDSRLRDRV
jgi:hypothetical protein